MTEKRFMLDDCGELIDLNTHKFVDYGEECCNLLNKLSEKNQNLQFLIIEMLDFIKENDGVTRQEMSDWWNNKVMSE